MKRSVKVQMKSRSIKREGSDKHIINSLSAANAVDGSSDANNLFNLLRTEIFDGYKTKGKFDKSFFIKEFDLRILKTYPKVLDQILDLISKDLNIPKGAFPVIKIYYFARPNNKYIDIFHEDTVARFFLNFGRPETFLLDPIFKVKNIDGSIASCRSDLEAKFIKLNTNDYLPMIPVLRYKYTIKDIHHIDSYPYIKKLKEISTPRTSFYERINVVVDYIAPPDIAHHFREMQAKMVKEVKTSFIDGTSDKTIKSQMLDIKSKLQSKIPENPTQLKDIIESITGSPTSKDDDISKDHDDDDDDDDSLELQKQIMEIKSKSNTYLSDIVKPINDSQTPSLYDGSLEDDDDSLEIHTQIMEIKSKNKIDVSDITQPINDSTIPSLELETQFMESNYNLLSDSIDSLKNTLVSDSDNEKVTLNHMDLILNNNNIIGELMNGLISDMLPLFETCEDQRNAFVDSDVQNIEYLNSNNNDLDINDDVDDVDDDDDDLINQIKLIKNAKLK